MEGDEIEVEVGRWPLRAKLHWDDRKPRVERSVDEGGKIVDRYELIAAERLLITRTVEGGPGGGGIELRFVYDRAPNQSGSSPEAGTASEGVLTIPSPHAPS